MTVILKNVGASVTIITCSAAVKFVSRTSTPTSNLRRALERCHDKDKTDSDAYSS